MTSYTKTICLAAAACGLAAAALAADYAGYTPHEKLSGEMRFVGESSAEPLFTLWVDAFKAVQPGVKVIARPTSPLACLP